MTFIYLRLDLNTLVNSFAFCTSDFGPTISRISVGTGYHSASNDAAKLNDIGYSGTRGGNESHKHQASLAYT